MKLRLEEHSLRLRLSEAEVQQFAQTGRVAYSIAFGPAPDQMLLYALEKMPVAAVATTPQVRYTAGALAVEVPAALAQDWTDTEKNGFSAQIRISDDQELRILVEKDLDCRH